MTLAQFEQSRALPASSEESKLRKLVLGMQDQLDAKDIKIAAQTQSQAMVEAQLAASRHETVNALLLLQNLSKAEESIEQRREKTRTRTGRRRRGGAVEGGEEDAEDSRLYDSLDISDLQTSPVPRRRSPAPHASAHVAKARELKEVTAMVELGVGGVRARLEEVGAWLLGEGGWRAAGEELRGAGGYA